MLVVYLLSVCAVCWWMKIFFSYICPRACISLGRWTLSAIVVISYSRFSETCCLNAFSFKFASLHVFLFLQNHVLQTLSELCRPLTVTACLGLEASRARVSVCDSWCETLASVTAYAGNVLWFSGRGRAKKEQDNKSFSLRLTPERGGVIRGRG